MQAEQGVGVAGGGRALGSDAPRLGGRRGGDGREGKGGGLGTERRDVALAPPLPWCGTTRHGAMQKISLLPAGGHSLGTK